LNVFLVLGESMGSLDPRNRETHLNTLPSTAALGKSWANEATAAAV
jgi:hypothetical protein